MTPTQIKRLRARHGLTQERLGLLLGHAKNGGLQVRRWELDLVTPTAAAARCLRYIDAILTALASNNLKGLPRVYLRDAIERKLNR